MTARPAVLVVDAVEACFGAPGSVDESHVAALAAARSVVVAAREAGVPVIHSRLQFRADGLDGGHYFRHDPGLAVFAGTTSRPCPEVEPIPSELVVTRTYPSAFFGTSLAATLRGAAVDTVVVVGAATSGSIRLAAVDALQHGFVPVVVSDAVADASIAAHDEALLDLSAHYAELRTAAQVRSGLGETAPIGG